MGRLFTTYTENLDSLSYNTIKKLGTRPCWIRIVHPSIEKLKILSELTKISLQDLRVDVQFSERPKIHTMQQYVQITYKTPHMEDEQLVTIPFHIFVIKNCIVTIEKEPTKIINDLATELEHSESKRPIGFFIFEALDKVNDEFLYRVENIGEKLEVFEKRLNLKEEELETLYNYSIALTYFNQALVANLEVLNSLKKSSSKLFNARDREKFTDLYIEALHVLDTQKIQRDIIASLRGLQDSYAQKKMNEFIKRLTAVTVVLMVPTLITGIYGMNFEFIPLFHHPAGFYITIGGIVLITLILVWIFYKAKWF